MATYQSVQRQIAELQKKAEVLRKAEAAKVIAGIKTQIVKYALTPSDLFESGVADSPAATVSPQKPTAQSAGKAVAKKPEKLAPKYMDPATKKTWSGWGKAPAWIKTGKREDFLIDKAQPPVAPQVKAAAKKSTAPVKATVKPAAKTVAVKTSKKPTAAKVAVPALKAASKSVAKKPAVAVKAKPAPAAKAKAPPVAKPAAVAKTKTAPVAKPAAAVKTKAVTTPAPKTVAVKPKAAPAKKTPSAKRPAVPPPKSIPAEQSAGADVPVTAPAPVGATPAVETGTGE